MLGEKGTGRRDEVGECGRGWVRTVYNGIHVEMP